MEQEGEGVAPTNRNGTGRGRANVSGTGGTGRTPARAEFDGVGDEPDSRTSMANQSEQDVSDMDDSPSNTGTQKDAAESRDEIPAVCSVGRRSRSTRSTDGRGDEQRDDPTQWREADDTEPGGSPDIPER